jgi:cytochrome b
MFLWFFLFFFSLNEGKQTHLGSLLLVLLLVLLMIGVMGKADGRIHKVYVVGIAYSMQGLLENCSL